MALMILHRLMCVSAVLKPLGGVVHFKLSYRSQTHMLLGEMVLNHTAIMLEGMHMADNLTLSPRRSREERLCHGRSCLAVGIDGLKQQGLGFVEQEETQAGG